MIAHLATLTGLGLFIWAALQDIGFRLVSNLLPALIMACGLACRAATGSLPAGLTVAGGIFVLAAICWRLGWLGGADVKLFGAGGLLLPPSHAAGFVLAACLAGGLLALLYAIAGRFVRRPEPLRPGSLVARLWRVERRRLLRRGPLPYAVAICAGAAISLSGGI